MAEQKAAVQVDAETRTPGGFRRREFIEFGADKAADGRHERLADDPYAYAAEHPVLGQSHEDVIALQKAMGVEAYAFMPASEAAERVRTDTATSGADKAALLRQWPDEAGKRRPAPAAPRREPAHARRAQPQPRGGGSGLPGTDQGPD